MSTSEPPPVPPGAPPPPPPPPPAPPVVQEWRSLQGLKTALTWLLAIDGIISAVVIAAVVNRINVIDDVRDGRSFGIAARAQDADDFASAAGGAFLLFVVVTGVCFIVWTWRAAKNNEALGRVQPRLTAAWAIAGWLIPLAWFVIPVLVVQDLWRGSDPSVPPGDTRWKIGARSGLVGWWWALCLLSVIRIYAGGNTQESNDTLSEIRSSNVRAGIGALFTIGAAVLAILVVRRITERQEECRRVQQAQSSAPPPPPAP